MFVVKIVSLRDELVIPTVISGLVSANQENRSASRVKRIEHAEWATTDFHAQLAHMPMTRSSDRGGVRMIKRGPVFLQKGDRRRQFVLLVLSQVGPPVAELVGELDLPHYTNMTRNEL